MAFESQEASFVNAPQSSLQHYRVIDKIAQTKSGDAPILTVPLVNSSSQCCGVIQFFRLFTEANGEPFTNQDIRTVSAFAPDLVNVLLNLAQNPDEEIPSIEQGKTIYCSILFTDIRSYSQIAEKISLSTSIKLLNQYYTRIINIVERNGGHLQSYAGDGLFAHFHTPAHLDCADKATLCGYEIQQEYRSLWQSWEDYGLPVSPENTHNVGIAICDETAAQIAPTYFLVEQKDTRENGPIVKVVSKRDQVDFSVLVN